MYKRLLSLSLWIIIFIFFGCDNGQKNEISIESNNSIESISVNDNMESTIMVNRSSTVLGRVIDGELIYATVFLDLNRNRLLDSNEPKAKTDKNGEYTLTVSAEVKEHENYLNNSAPLVSIGGFDKKSKKEFIGTFTAPFSEDNPNITPMTTLINEMLEADENQTLEDVKSTLARGLGISAENLMKDPVELAKSGDASLLELSLKIHKSSEILSKCLVDNKESIEIYALMAKALSGNNISLDQALEKTVNDNSESFDSSLVEISKVAVEELNKNIRGLFENHRDDFLNDTTVITQIALNLEKTQDQIVDAVNKNQIESIENITWEDNNVADISKEIVRQLLLIVGYENDADISDIAKFNAIDDDLTLESLKVLLESDGNYGHVIDIIDRKIKDLNEEKGKNSEAVEVSASLNSFTIKQVRDSDWNDGFCEKVEVKNIGTSDAKWQVEITVDGLINNLWSGSYTQNGTTGVVRVSGVSWNSMLRPDQTTSFGYCASKVVDSQASSEESSSDSSKLVVSQNRDSDWNSGFCENIKVTNNENQKVTDWEVSFALEGQINNFWNGAYTQDEDLKVIAKGLSWNRDIPADGSVEFGYCANKVQTPTTPDKIAVIDDKKALTFNSIKLENLSKKKIISGLNLMTTGSNGSTIRWESNNLAISSSGEITRPAFGERAIRVKLLAVIKKGKYRKTKRFNLKVLALEKSDTLRVNEAKEALTFNTIRLENKTEQEIISDLNLITQGQSNVTISWQSTSSAIATNGKVTQPIYDNLKSAVTLTATLSAGNISDSKTFNLTVLPLDKSDKDIVLEVKEDLTFDKIRLLNLREEQIYTNLNLILVGKYETTIRWSSSNSSVLSSSGVVTRPEASQSNEGVTLRATISKGEEHETVTFNLIVIKKESVVEPPLSSESKYQDLLSLSLKFYEAQRAIGPFPTVTWREPATTHDGSDVGVDLNGGWFDAGDHVKFNQPMSYTTTMLNWSLIKDKDVYAQAGKLIYGKSQVKYALDYLLKTYDAGVDHNSASDDKVYFQVEDGNDDHSAGWIAPHQITKDRPTFTCDKNSKCSAISAQMSASFASGAILFADEPLYANRLLESAREIFKFAETYQGDAGSNAKASPFYTSNGFKDELGLASMWLYKATGESAYLEKAKTYVEEGEDPIYWVLSWENVNFETRLLLLEETGNQIHAEPLESNLNNWLTGVAKTSAGYRHLSEWGSMRYNANASFVALAYSELIDDEVKKRKYLEYAKGQMDYLLGDNPTNFSYVVGYGENYPKKVHHRGATGFNDEHSSNENLYPIEGALIGGFKSADDYDYKNNGGSRSDYYRNEVATDYNAGFTGALAKLARVYGEPIVLKTDEEIVSLDTQNLTFDTIKNQNSVASDIRSNLNLPTQGSLGATISWVSNQPNSISNSGVVSALTTDITVLLTATITKGTASETKVFSLVVKSQEETTTENNTTQSQGGKRMVIGYLPTWAIQGFHEADYADSQIAKIDELYTHVVISFVQPNLSFNGTNFTGTGVEFSSYLPAIKKAIESLQARGVKVLLAVGGASYNEWSGLIAEQGQAIENTTYKKALKSLMSVLDLDGLDVDYEVSGALVADVNNYYKAILSLKEVAGEKLLTLAGWSTGADCTADTTADLECSGKRSFWSGSAGRERLTFKKLKENGYRVEDVLDYVAIMSYDGGIEHFDPVTLFKNYQEIYSGPLAMGFEIPYESWGGAELVSSNAEALNCASTSMLKGDSYAFDSDKVAYSVERLVNYVNSVPNAGVMLWSLYENKSTLCANAVNYTTITSAIKTYLDQNTTDSNSTNVTENNNSNTQTDTASVASAKEALTFDTIKNQNSVASDIRSNLNLPTQGSLGATISWVSNQPNSISNSGVVSALTTDITVLLTATITKGTANETKVFSLVVVKEALNAGFCQADYNVNTEWASGAGISMKVTNHLGNLSSWEVTFTFPSTQTIDGDLWNGIETQTERYVQVLNEGYNGDVSDGGLIEFGFNLKHNGRNDIPTDIRLNGKLCDGQIGGLEKPSKPTNLIFELINNVKVNLGWDDNSESEDSFILYQKVDDGDWTIVSSLPANTKEYSGISLETDKRYTFKVEAKNLAGVSTSDSIEVQPLHITVQGGTDNRAVALVSNCSSCHVAKDSDPAIPIIHGLGKNYLDKILNGYGSGDHFGYAMPRVMDGYSSDELDFMSSYFSSQVWIGNEITSYDVETIKEGESLYKINCTACHGTDGKQEGMILSKQSEVYLVDTMSHYAKGLNLDAHSGMEEMFKNTIGDDATKIRALAKYLAVGLTVPTGTNETIRGFDAKYVSRNNSIIASWEFINENTTRLEVLVNGSVIKTLTDLENIYRVEILNDGSNSFVIGEQYDIAIKAISATTETPSVSVAVAVMSDEDYGKEHYNTNCKVCHGVNGTARADITAWNPNSHSFTAFTRESNMASGYYANCDDECLELIGVYVRDVLEPRSRENNDSAVADVNSDIPRGYRLLNSVEYTNTIHTLFETNADAQRVVTLALDATELPKDNIVEGYNTDRDMNRIDEDKITALNVMATRVEGYLLELQGGTGSSCLINDYDFCVADKSEFLTTFATKIFRRPLDATEIRNYQSLSSVAQIVGDMLVSPKFLYRSEMGTKIDGSSDYLLSQYEIATALAYSISGTTPDAELLALAEEGALSDANRRVTQAVRLSVLQTGKDKLDDFIGRWLLEDNIYSLFDKNPERFTGYNNEVRTAQSRQIVEYFRMVMQSSSNSAYKDLFINENMMSNRILSDYYGEEMSSSTIFEKVPATATRYGILTLGALASKYANSEESHPFKRGKFILARLMCHPLGLPGNGGDVPAIKDHQGENKRDRYAEHVNDPSCATCHNLMDPIGFTWEKYDGSGRYRTAEWHSQEDGGAKAIDTSVTLKGLLSFDQAETHPANGMRDVSELIAESDRGPECIALQYYRYISGDSHAEIENSLVVKKIASDFKDEAYDLQSLFTNMVKLNSFITRKGE